MTSFPFLWKRRNTQGSSIINPPGMAALPRFAGGWSEGCPRFVRRLTRGFSGGCAKIVRCLSKVYSSSVCFVREVARFARVFSEDLPEFVQGFTRGF